MTLEPVRLTGVQRAIWFQEQAEPRSEYVIAVGLELRGPLEEASVRTAVETLVSRHEALRVVVRGGAGGPEGFVDSNIAGELSLVDVSAAAPLDRRTAARHVALRQARAPFDLARGPLWRFTLVRIDRDHHVVLIAVHHLIGDADSMGTLVTELWAGYQDRVDRRSTSGPVACARFSSFADWEAARRDGGRHEQQVSRWRDHLGDAAHVRLPLPAVHPPGTGTISVRLDVGAGSAVTAMCRARQTTPFVVITAAVAAVVARHFGVDRLVLGFPFSRRYVAGCSGTIGNFLTTLPLPVDLRGHLPFAALVDRVRRSVAFALGHADVSLADIAGAAGAPRSADRNPFFDVLVNGVNPLPSVRIRGLECRLLDPDEPELAGHGPAKFPATFYIGSEARAYSVRSVFKTQHFEPAGMGIMLAQVRALLTAAASQPDMPLDLLDARTPECVRAVPDTVRPVRHSIVPAVLRQIADVTARDPARVAIVARGYTLTYQDCEERAAALAGRLRRGGVNPGDTVAVTGARSAGVVVAALAIWRLGAIVVLLDSSVPLPRRERMLHTARVTHVVGIDGAHRELEAGTWPALALSASGEVPGPADAAPYPALPDAPAGASPAYVVFTSGSTGAPKAILGTHEGLAHFVEWEKRSFDVSPGDRVAHVTALSFDVVLREIFVPLAAGASLHIPDEPMLGARAFQSLVEGGEVTIVHAVPTLASLWLSGWQGQRACGALRLTLFAGEPLSDRLVTAWRSRFPRTSVVNLYGPSETTLAKAFWMVPDPPRPGIQPVGRGIEGAHLHVLTRAGRACARGEVGEVVIRTPYRTLGYLTPEGLTPPFVPNPWAIESADDLLYWTGDLGRYDSSGAVELLGRVDDQVKIRGVRVNLNDVRSALLQLPDVKDAHVALAEGDGRPRLVAWIVSTADSRRAWRSALQMQLAAAAVPDQWLLVSELPKMANGKVDRRALLDRLDASPDVGETRLRQPPRTALESLVVDVWKSALGRGDVDVTANFFDVGGDSLTLLRVRDQLADRLAVAVPVTALFEHPTARALADHLGTLTEAAAPLPAPLDLPARPRRRHETFVEQSRRRADLRREWR